MRSGLLDELESRLGGGLRSDAARVGLPESTARVLLAIGAEEAVSMGELARRIGRDPSTATRFVDRAARDGLVSREPGEDRRKRLARLTAEGRGARARLVALRDARARSLPDEVRDRTGLAPDAVEWFLESLVGALTRSGRGAPPPV
jgi:DNA-binding MarR family transcriptional regulator